MHIFQLPKRNGKFRTIYAPSRSERAACLSLLPALALAASARDRHGVQHGFTAGRSPVTNALAHRDYRHTLKFDLEHFFDTVTPALVLPALRGQSQVLLHGTDPRLAAKLHEVEQACFFHGAARQGLPTSPALANLAAAALDDAIMALGSTGLRRFQPFVYTRYADDLTFSFDHPSVGEMLRRRVPELVRAHGFAINPAKTRWQSAAAGRRHITGVAVDASLHPPRSLKRRLRAARHALGAGRRLGTRAWRRYTTAHPQGTPLRPSFRAWLHAQVDGLSSWLALRPPRRARSAPPAALPAPPAASLPTPPAAPALRLRRAL